MKNLKLILIVLLSWFAFEVNAQDPTTQASNVTIYSRTQSTLSVSWTRGNGEYCLVVCKPQANAYGYPVDGLNSSYGSSSNYGSGSNLGNSNYVVYNGTGSSMTISGLSASTYYAVMVYEYNITNIFGNNYYYLTSVNSGNYEANYTLCTQPTVNATALAASSVSYTTATLAWATGNSSYTLCALDNYSSGSSYTYPSDGTLYSASTIHGSGTALYQDNYVVYNSSGTSVNVTNLLPATTYLASVFEYCGSSTGNTWNYMTSSVNYIYFTTLNNVPTINTISNITVCQNAGATAVNLSGITDGSTQESQNLTVTASSSNTTLIPNGNISIAYTSPNSTGTLTFTPATGQYGTSTISVVVNDGFASNNTVTKTFTVTVNPPPGSIASISSSTYLCKNGSNYVFTCSAAANATGYNWTFPSGTVIVSGTNTNSITVNFPSSIVASSGSVGVYATNTFGCGNGPSSAKTIYFDALPVVADAGTDMVICTNTAQLDGNDATPGYGYWDVVSGTASFVDNYDYQTNVTSIAPSTAVTLSWTTYSYYGVCPSSTDLVVVDYDPAAVQCLIYSDFIASTTTPCLNGDVDFTDNSVGATSYSWNFGAGATPSTSTSSDPTVTYTTPGLHTVTLTVTGPNGNDTETKTGYINVLDVPGNAGAISGDFTVCAGETQVLYSVGSINNATNYIWTLPSGATINSGTGTNSVSVNYATNATSGVLSVQGENICGTGAISNLNITVSPLPANAGIISGDNQVCQGETGVVYSIPTIANAVSYNWTVPTGATITLNTGTSITVDFTNLAIDGDVTVYATNACGDGLGSTLSVQVNPLPGIAGSISGPVSITNCPISTGIEYAIDSVANATSYLWNTPNGSSIVAGNNSDTILVDFAFGANSGNVTVIPQNACGNGTSNSISILVDDAVSQNICLVTVDETSDHNVIVWEKNETPVLASFNIYREVTTNVYSLIANIHKDSLSEYHDTAVNPNVTSYKYKITALDTCGNESGQSDFHNTIHLQFLGSGNLQWTLYDIENAANPVDFYEVFRDDSSTGSWNSISATIPGGNSTFTDVDYANFTNPSYRVDVIWATTCTSSRAGVNTSRSNVKNAPASGLNLEEWNAMNNLKLYPNPANNSFMIDGITNGKVSIFNSVGQMVYTGNVTKGMPIDISGFSNGIYSVKIEWENYMKINKLIKN